MSGIAISLCEAEEIPYLKDIQKLIGKTIPEIKDHAYPMSKSNLALLADRPGKAPVKPSQKAKTNPPRKPKSEWFVQGKQQSGGNTGGAKGASGSGHAGSGAGSAPRSGYAGGGARGASGSQANASGRPGGSQSQKSSGGSYGRSNQPGSRPGGNQGGRPSSRPAAKAGRS